MKIILWLEIRIKRGTVLKVATLEMLRTTVLESKTSSLHILKKEHWVDYILCILFTMLISQMFNPPFSYLFFIFICEQFKVGEFNLTEVKIIFGRWLCYIVHGGLEFTNIWSQILKCWDHRHETPHYFR